jgi:hypothetical protein
VAVALPREVGQGAGLGLEPVVADDQAHAVEQFGPVRGQTPGEGGQAGAGDARGTLRGDDHEHEQADLLADGQRVAEGLGDEQRRHGEVDRGPVEVEEYPVGTTIPATGWLTPACSILAISRGSAVSDEDVARISRNSRPRYFISEKTFTPAMIRRIRPRTPNTKTAQVM